MKRPRALFTQLHNDKIFFNLWLKYYQQFFDPEDIYVIHNIKPREVDFDHWLPAQEGFVRIPTPDVQKIDFQLYVDRINSLQRQLLQRYEVVLLAEVDEFVAHRDGLSTYINNWTGNTVVCKGYEIVHRIDEEPPLDLSRPIMAQRKWWYPCHNYDKPLLSRIPLTYHHGCHYCHEFPWQTTDPNLLLIHLHKVDFDLCVNRKWERMKNDDSGNLTLGHLPGTPEWYSQVSEPVMKLWLDTDFSTGLKVEKTEIPEDIRRWVPL